jgi:nucleoid DNA-binding protein
MKRKKSKLNSIISEIAYDLGVDKKTVRKVITALFQEIAFFMILKGKPVMIRRFVKFVLAARMAKKIKRNYNNFKTKLK